VQSQQLFLHERLLPLPGHKVSTDQSLEKLRHRNRPGVLEGTRSCDILIQHEERKMRNEFTAVFEKDGDWYIGYCPEIPGANGQGRTIEECRKSLAEAISLVLEDRREDARRGIPSDARQETITIT
jgi:predicted RNase H-like HicB family nuclease